MQRNAFYFGSIALYLCLMFFSPQHKGKDEQNRFDYKPKTYGQSIPTRVEKDRPDIVLISIDTLRRDYFSAQSMPMTYEWVKKNAMIFTNAYSNSTWTLPSHVTMLTGTLQRDHGVEYLDSVVPCDVKMIQEKLVESGYYTAGFVNGGFVSRHHKLNRGFDVWQDIFIPTGKEYPECLLDMFKASEDMAASPPSRQMFMFVHTYYVHDYYAKRISFYGDCLDIISKKEDSSKKLSAITELRKILYESLVREEFSSLCKNYYTRTVLELDERLCNYLQRLVASPLSQDPGLYIIITSDHGESFHDRCGDKFSGFGHSGPPHYAQIRIPLIIYGVGVGEDNRLISLANLSNIIYDISQGKSPDFQTEKVIAEYYTIDRHTEPKVRCTTKITNSGEGGVITIIGAKSKADKVTGNILPKDHKDQIRALGYIE